MDGDADPVDACWRASADGIEALALRDSAIEGAAATTSGAAAP
jgi:hypothetical protein